MSEPKPWIYRIYGSPNIDFDTQLDTRKKARYPSHPYHFCGTSAVQLNVQLFADFCTIFNAVSLQEVKIIKLKEKHFLCFLKWYIFSFMAPSPWALPPHGFGETNEKK